MPNLIGPREQGTPVKIRDGPAAVTDVIRAQCPFNRPSIFRPLLEPGSYEKANRRNIGSQKTYLIIGHDVTFLEKVRVMS